MLTFAPIAQMANSIASSIMPPSSDAQSQATKAAFTPAIKDVIEARDILTSLGTKNDTLPMEIALMILSLASYRPRQVTTKAAERVYIANQFWSEGPKASVAGFYFTAPTLLSVPDTVARPASITFRLKSADQGWATFGGDGTYDNSHTWFEASILRPSSDSDSSAFETIAIADLEVPNFRTPGEARGYLRGHGWDMVENEGDGDVVWRVHNNITACRTYKDYRVEWVAGVPTDVGDPRAMGDGKGFLEMLRSGDVVALWARAEVSDDHHQCKLCVCCVCAMLTLALFISNKLGKTGLMQLLLRSSMRCFETYL